MVRQADDSFVCFGAKPDKGFWTRDLGWQEVGRERRSERFGKRSSRKQLAKGDARWQSTRDSRETNRHEIGSSHSEEDRLGLVGIPSSVVEFSLESTLASVYICTQEMQCCITPFLRLNWPQHIIRLFSFLLLIWL